MSGICGSSIGDRACSTVLSRCALALSASDDGGPLNGDRNVPATDVSVQEYEQARRDAGLPPIYRALQWPAFEDRYDEEATPANWSAKDDV